MKTFEKVVHIVKEKWFVFLASFIIFILLSIILNRVNYTMGSIHSYYRGFGLFLFILVNFVLVPILVATVFSMMIYRSEEIGKMQGKSGFFGILGAILGIFGGACPVCFAGLFPVILGLFGVSLSLSSLPLSGFEFGIVSTVLLLIGVFYLAKDVTCKIKIKKVKK